MARLLPDISRLILSSVGQAGRPLPRPVENASSTIASTSAPPSVSSNLQPATTEQQQQAPMLARPLPLLVSVSGSDPMLNVHGLQRELVAGGGGCPRARRAGGASGSTPDCEGLLDLTSSRAQVTGLFTTFKCPLHWAQNHSCTDCYVFNDAGYLVTKEA
jgi:hypothetical protein